MPVAANVRFIFVALVLGTGLAQRTGPKAADSAGRATPEQREHAGIGAAVPTLRVAETLFPSQQAQRVAGWPAEIRKQLFIPAVLPSLDARTWSTFSPMPGVLADRVSYATANGMLVPAIVYRPDPAVAHWKGKLPGIVIVNGHGGDKFSWYAFYSGMLFAKSGAMVVTYDPRHVHHRIIRFVHDEHRAALSVERIEDGTAIHPPEWFAHVRQRALALVGANSPASRNMFTTVVYPEISHRTSWVDRQGRRMVE